MMESATKNQQSIAAEAADWYARLRGESLSELDAARFRTWLAGDPARRGEFEAITRLWDELTAIEDSPEVRQARESIAVRRREARALRLADEERVSSTRGARPIKAVVWASAAAVILAVGVYWPGARDTPDTYSTEVGEQRTVPLEDGSVVKLNTATEIRLQYSAAVREIELISGQASFEVAKDAARPFVVIAGNGQVRAVGTVFDVYKSGDQVKVTLIEGRVAVRAASVTSGTKTTLPHSNDGPRPGTSDEVVLAAGEQLVYGDEAPAMKPVAADLQRAIAWQSRKLDFSDTPLHEAIAEANRYARDQIVLQAPALQNARISGTFEAGKNELLAQGLQAYFHLEVEHRPDRSIVLTAPDR